MHVQTSIKVLPTNYISREDNYKMVDEALVIIKKSGIKHIIGASETTLEGEFNDILKLINDIQNYYYNNGVKNFNININIEYNADNFYIEEKMENVNKL